MGAFLVEGLELGVEKEENNALKTINEFGQNILDEFNINKELENMYKEMSNTIKMENEKMNFDVMSNNTYNRSMQLPPY